MDVVYANKTCYAGGHQIIRGSVWPADDPVAVAYPDHFTDDPRFLLTSSRPLGEDGYPVVRSPRTETASAAPGEKRARSRNL